MKNRDAIRANERYKSASRTVLQLGSALLAAAVIRIYGAKGVSWETLVWLVVSGTAIWVGMLMLSLLDSEDL